MSLDRTSRDRAPQTPAQLDGYALPSEPWNPGHVYEALDSNLLSKAAHIASSLVARDPCSIDAHIALCDTLNRCLRHDEAAIAAKRTMSLDPFHLGARTSYAGSLISRGLYQEA